MMPRTIAIYVLGGLLSVSVSAEEFGAPTTSNETALAASTNAIPVVDTILRLLTHEEAIKQGRFTVGARSGSSSQEYFAGGMHSLSSFDGSVLFGDIRVNLLEDSEQEFNLGLVFRQATSDGKAILGANAYYDGRWTDEDNFFSQMGAGIELLTTLVDARANYYYPLNDPEKLADSIETDVRVSGATRVTETRHLRSYEEALEGVDAEIGAWIPLLSEKVPTGVFVGYYDFFSDIMEDISGFKVRLESRLHKQLILDAEWFEDEVLNHSEYLVGLRFEVPFGRMADSDTAQNGLASRMNERVQRDFRIRTITTRPVLLHSEVTEERVSRRSGGTEDRSTPVCFLDTDGDVICF